MTKRLLLAVAVAAAGVLSFSTPAGATTGSWERISAYNSGLVVTVPSPYTTNDLQTEIQPYGAMAYNGQWMFTDAGGGTYTIQNRYSNQCLDVENGLSTVVGSPVVQRPCDGTQSQRWVRTLDPIHPVWHISNFYSGLFLGVDGGSSSAGAGLIQGRELPNNTSRMFQVW
jgi:hypothetical protein